LKPRSHQHQQRDFRAELGVHLCLARAQSALSFHKQEQLVFFPDPMRAFSSNPAEQVSITLAKLSHELAQSNIALLPVVPHPQLQLYIRIAKAMKTRAVYSWISSPSTANPKAAAARGEPLNGLIFIPPGPAASRNCQIPVLRALKVSQIGVCRRFLHAAIRALTRKGPGASGRKQNTVNHFAKFRLNDAMSGCLPVSEKPAGSSGFPKTDGSSLSEASSRLWPQKKMQFRDARKQFLPGDSQSAHWQ
jgi:hypothetical protein